MSSTRRKRCRSSNNSDSAGSTSRANNSDCCSSGSEHEECTPTPLALTRLAICRMAATSGDAETICADPIHHHSFAAASALFSFAAVRSCGMCGGRLISFFGGEGAGGGGGGASGSADAGGAGGKLVKCLACGVYAHRGCAFRNYAVHCALLSRGAGKGNRPSIPGVANADICCSVNGPLIKKLGERLGISQEEDDDDEAVVVSSCTSDSNQFDEEDDGDLDTVHENGDGGDDADDSKSVINVDEVPPILASKTADPSGDDAEAPAQSFLSRIGWGSRQASTLDSKPDIKATDEAIFGDGNEESIEGSTESNDKPISDDKDDDDEELTWSEDGPDKEDTLRGLPSSSTSISGGKKDGEDADAPIVPSAQPFSSVAKALHENVLPLFLGKQQAANDDIMSKEEQKVNESLEKSGENSKSGEGEVSDDGAKEDAEKVPAISEGSEPQIEPPDASQEEVAGILPELDPKAPPPPPPPPPSTFATAVEVVRTSRRTRSNMGVASVAGSIVGGVAGLALAGPAGAIMLSKVCQTAGVLSVLLDGTMSIGVLVAGAAAAKFAAEQVAQGGSRMLALGGGREGSRAVMLVRPNVVVDPVWGGLTDDAKRSHPKVLATTKRTLSGAGFLANHQAKVADQAKIRRNEVDADIVNSEEYEITTPDKVVLIVSRSLNDRLSLPGHVYNKLIHEYKRRAEERKMEETDTNSNGKRKETKAIDNDNADDANGSNDEDDESNFCRVRRQDAHGVIKHVTATLLEVRPGLGATSRLTELTASAVESLVFGELYGSVFEEICDETGYKDDALMSKIYRFESEHQARRKACMEELSDSREEGGGEADDEFVDCVEFPITDENISVGALGALLSMSDAKSSVDKLEHCVKFLEAISVHFDQAAGGGKAVSADYLLKMVCEHIIVAKVPRLNAELAFLEEFARDEQLLRGKEGYSLVTLQASLHFLNASNDFDADIFQDEY